MRIPQWEFVEGSESDLPESYRWSDWGSYGNHDRHIWKYIFAHDPSWGVPSYFMRVSLGWKNKEKTPGLYRCLKWEIKTSSAEEILFDLQSCPTT